MFLELLPSLNLLALCGKYDVRQLDIIPHILIAVIFSNV
jgi:hypothetical protein